MAYNRKKRSDVLKEKEVTIAKELYAEEIREKLKQESKTCAGCLRVSIVIGTVMIYCGAIIFFIFILIAR